MSIKWDEWLIRVIGGLGILINLIAVLTKSADAFLLGQIVASTCALLWNRYLSKATSWDNWLAYILTFVAVITKDEFWLYGSILSRSISYQLLSERVFTRNNKQT